MSSERLRSFIREYVETLLAALLIAVLIRVFVLTAFKIPTSSMLPTLQVGDFVFAYRLPYGLQLPFATQKLFQTTEPERGDVVVFRYPGDDNLNFIKRVVATDGDKVEIRNRRLYVNDVPSTYERVEGEVPQVPGQEYYSVLREKAGESTRLVMFKKGSTGGDFGPDLVPPGHIFVLGDNRDSTDDSRYWGMIPADRVDGRIVAIWLSLDWESASGIGPFPRVRWERVLARVD